MLAVLRSIGGYAKPVKLLDIAGASFTTNLGRYAAPTYDKTFKKIFADESRKDLTISLINALLFPEGPQVEDLDIMNPEIPGNYQNHVQTTVDVRCRLSDDREVIVEMQGSANAYSISETQYYAARMLVNNLLKGYGSKYHYAPEVYVLTIAKEVIFGRDDTRLKYKDLEGAPALMEDKLYKLTVEPAIKEAGLTLSPNKLFWTYYQLPYFNLEEQEDKHSLTSQWLNFLKTCADHDEIPTDIDDKIKEAYEIMDIYTWPPEVVEAYINSMDAEMSLIQAKLALEKSAKEEGRAKGREEGREETMLAVAQSLFKSGDDIERVHQVTGIAQSRLQELQIDLTGSKREYHTFPDIPDYDAATEIDSSSSVLGELGLSDIPE